MNYFRSCSRCRRKFSTAPLSSLLSESILSGLRPSKARMRFVSSTEQDISPFSSVQDAMRLTPGISADINALMV